MEMVTVPDNDDELDRMLEFEILRRKQIKQEKIESPSPEPRVTTPHYQQQYVPSPEPRVTTPQYQQQYVPSEQTIPQYQQQCVPAPDQQVSTAQQRVPAVPQQIPGVQIPAAHQQIPQVQTQRQQLGCGYPNSQTSHMQSFQYTQPCAQNWQQNQHAYPNNQFPQVPRNQHHHQQASYSSQNVVPAAHQHYQQNLHTGVNHPNGVDIYPNQMSGSQQQLYVRREMPAPRRPKRRKEKQPDLRREISQHQQYTSSEMYHQRKYRFIQCLSQFPHLSKLMKDPNIVQKFVENPQLAQALARKPHIARALTPGIAKLLFDDPKFLHRLFDDTQILDQQAGLCSDHYLLKFPHLSELVVSNPKIAQKFIENPQLADALARNPHITEALTKDPTIATMFLNDPKFINELLKFPILEQQANSHFNQQNMHLSRHAEENLVCQHPNHHEHPQPPMLSNSYQAGYAHGQQLISKLPPVADQLCENLIKYCDYQIANLIKPVDVSPKNITSGFDTASSIEQCLSPDVDSQASSIAISPPQSTVSSGSVNQNSTVNSENMARLGGALVSSRPIVDTVASPHTNITQGVSPPVNSKNEPQLNSEVVAEKPIVNEQIPEVKRKEPTNCSSGAKRKSLSLGELARYFTSPSKDKPEIAPKSKSTSDLLSFKSTADKKENIDSEKTNLKIPKSLKQKLRKNIEPLTELLLEDREQVLSENYDKGRADIYYDALAGLVREVDPAVGKTDGADKVVKTEICSITDDSLSSFSTSNDQIDVTDTYDSKNCETLQTVSETPVVGDSERIDSEKVIHQDFCDEENIQTKTSVSNIVVENSDCEQIENATEKKMEVDEVTISNEDTNSVIVEDVVIDDDDDDEDCVVVNIVSSEKPRAAPPTEILEFVIVNQKEPEIALFHDLDYSTVPPKHITWLACTVKGCLFTTKSAIAMEKHNVANHDTFDIRNIPINEPDLGIVLEDCDRDGKLKKQHRRYVKRQEQKLKEIEVDHSEVEESAVLDLETDELPDLVLKNNNNNNDPNFKSEELAKSDSTLLKIKIRYKSEKALQRRRTQSPRKSVDAVDGVVKEPKKMKRRHCSEPDRHEKKKKRRRRSERKESTETDDDDTPCAKCGIVYSERDLSVNPWIECDKCDHWFHGRCEKLSKREVELLGKSQEDYYCRRCRRKSREKYS